MPSHITHAPRPTILVIRLIAVPPQNHTCIAFDATLAASAATAAGDRLPGNQPILPIARENRENSTWSNILCFGSVPKAHFDRLLATQRGIQTPPRAVRTPYGRGGWRTQLGVARAAAALAEVRIQLVARGLGVPRLAADLASRPGGGRRRRVGHLRHREARGVLLHVGARCSVHLSRLKRGCHLHLLREGVGRRAQPT